MCHYKLFALTTCGFVSYQDDVLQDQWGWDNQVIKSQTIGMKQLTPEMLMARLEDNLYNVGSLILCVCVRACACVRVPVQCRAWPVHVPWGELACITADIKHHKISIMHGGIETR